MTTMTTSAEAGLKVREIHKSYTLGANLIEVLRGVSFELDLGNKLVLTGPSGSGKSTLLHIIGTLESPTSGGVVVSGQDTAKLSEPELAEFRNTQIGFVFQDSHLLPQYSVLDNVTLPALAFRRSADEVLSWAEELLNRVGLSHRLHHRPAELSGGERQRAAVARALINRPSLLLCDEPTGSLDGATAESTADLLFELHAEQQNMLLVVTHSQALAERFDHQLELREGQCCAL